MTIRQRSWIAGAGAAFALAFAVVAAPSSAQNAEPREIAPRGALTPHEQAVVELFEDARDSVVYISTAQASFGPETGPSDRTPVGAGSGFFWTTDGYVVTNYHVVAEASGITVLLVDGRQFDATYVGGDPIHDVAVVKIAIEGDAPRPIPVGTSADLRVGQSAYVIGSPFGLDWSLTAGVISALDRRIPAARGGLIQTDAPINSGNSGGPLIDSAGRLIGVNTAILSPSGVNAGVGFAVPVDIVNRIVPEIINTGDYAAPIIGVSIDSRVNEALQRDGVSGVAVLGIVPGTPAEKAGLEPAETSPQGEFTVRDVIVAVDDDEISTVSDLLDAVDSRAVGDEVVLLVERDGARREVTVRLGRRP